MDALNLAESGTVFYEIKTLELFGLRASGVHRCCLNAVRLEVGKGTVPAVKRSRGSISSLEGVPNFGEVLHAYRAASPSRRDSTDSPRWDQNFGGQRSRQEMTKASDWGCASSPLPCTVPFPRPCVCTLFEINPENPDKKIFVYCRLGDDRTGMMIAAYRMANKVGPRKAMKEMHSFGYTPCSRLICPGLAGYEKSFPERLKKSPAFSGTPLI